MNLHGICSMEQHLRATFSLFEHNLYSLTSDIRILTLGQKKRLKDANLVDDFMVSRTQVVRICIIDF